VKDIHYYAWERVREGCSAQGKQPIDAELGRVLKTETEGGRGGGGDEDRQDCRTGGEDCGVEEEKGVQEGN